MRTSGRLKRDYDTFKTAAFTGYAIPPELLQTVRPWIEEQFRQWNIDRKERILPAWDLGFAELSDITTKDQAFRTLADIYRMSTIDVDALGRSMQSRLQKRFIKNAGGRVGKGFYRYALKAFYLFQA
jgi:hypothetical protein